MAARSPLAVRLGYFGRPGSFSHLAARRRFASRELLAFPTIEECFAQLQGGGVTHVIVPVENASSGIITNTADQLLRQARSGFGERLRIREAMTMRIHLALMATSTTAKISRIYSHRAPFDHAREWLDKNYPEAEQVMVESTSEAAAQAALHKNSAAIASMEAATAHGLKIVAREVGEEANQTTFLLVGIPLTRRARATHTCASFELPHVAGSLVAVLEVLSRRQLNLTKILSRPIPGRFDEYRFMIEFLGAEPDPKVTEALLALRERTTFFAEIGAYAVRRL